MKAESNLPDAWEKLAAARRAAKSAASCETDDTAPFGFAQRIASRAMDMQRHRQLVWWTRWSLRAAGAAAAAAVLVALARAPETSGSLLLATPGLEVPGFPPL